MKKNALLSLLSLGLDLGGSTTILAVQKAAAEEDSSESSEAHDHFMDKVDRTVENIENGVVITLTSDDPDTVTKLQAIPEHPPQGETEQADVVRKVENLENGVKITITSDNSNTVKKIQKRASKEEHGKHRGGMMMNMEGVDRTVENIDNGVVITLTSDDPEIVQKLQTHAEGGFMSEDDVQEGDE